MKKELKPNAQGGVKDDGDKPRWELLPWESVTEIVKVLTNGAKKYTDDNWKHVESQRYQGAMMRHISAYMRGEAVDEEWGLHHLAHAGCCLLYLLWFALRDNAPDIDEKKFGEDLVENEKILKQRMEVMDILADSDLVETYPSYKDCAFQHAAIEVKKIMGKEFIK